MFKLDLEKAEEPEIKLQTTIGSSNWEIGIDIYMLLLLLLSRFSHVRLLQFHRRQPTRLPRPWDSPGKNSGMGCHFLLQCMKVKSLSRVRFLANPWTTTHQAPPSIEFSRQECWNRVPLLQDCVSCTPVFLVMTGDWDASRYVRGISWKTAFKELI